jgi:Leucine-rich repeat (LRR) protein
MKKHLIILILLLSSIGHAQELMNFYVEPDGTDMVTLHTVVYDNTSSSLGSYEVSFDENTINVTLCYLLSPFQSVTVDHQVNSINLPPGYTSYTIHIELYGVVDASLPCSFATLEDTGTITFDYPYNPTATSFIPDNVFEDYLESLGFGDDIPNNDLVFTHRINNNRHVFLGNNFIPLSGDVISMEGLQDFLGLRELRCYDNLITELDVSPNLFLEVLWCLDNPISELDLSNNLDLYWLWAQDMNLTTIDVTSNVHLQYLWVAGNDLSNVNLTQNINLKVLRLSRNLFENIDITQNTLLQELSIGSNLFTSIDLSNNVNLLFLSAGNGNINSLDLANNSLIEYLDLRNSFLTHLDVSNLTNLKTLICDRNQITTFDLNSNPALESVSVSDNNLTSLDLRNGNNENILNLYARDNDDLFCIDVDDPSAAPYPGWSVENQVIFSDDCSLGQEDFLISQIAIYPNPVSETLFIASEGISIEKKTVYSLQGKLVLSEMNASKTIDASNLSEGLYFIEISSSEGKSIQKFIKQ